LLNERFVLGVKSKLEDAFEQSSQTKHGRTRPRLKAKNESHDLKTMQ
jgi:hypothetical protein